MSKMSELDYEQRMAADQPSSMREAATKDRAAQARAAQAAAAARAEVAKAWAAEAAAWEAVAEAAEAAAAEYELWGRVFGSHGGRLSAMPIDPRGVWPDGTALYVRRVKK
jgi:hypothetical protein